MNSDNTSDTSLKSKAAVLISGTALFFAIGNLFDQVAMVKADPFVAALIRAIVVFVFSGTIFLLQRKKSTESPPVTSRKRAIIIYGGSGLCAEVFGMLSFYQAIKLGGISIAVPCTQTWLIWSALGGMLILGERTQLKTFIGLAFSVTGLILLIFFQGRGIPYTPMWKSGIAFGLLASLGWASSTILIRKGQIHGVNPYFGLAVQYLTAFIGIGTYIILSSRIDFFRQVPLKTYLYLFASSLSGGVMGMILMYQALHISPIDKVIPVLAIYPVIATIFGVLILKNFMNPGMLASILLVAAGIAISQIKISRKKWR